MIGAVAVAAVLPVLALSSPVAARDVTIGVEAIDYSPVYGWHNGAFVGAAREIFDAFAAESGYRLIYRPLPVRRLLAELIHGGIDLKFPDSPEWQKEARRGLSLVYSEPVIAYIDGTLVRREAAGQGRDAIRSLGTVAGFTPYAWREAIAAGRVELKENPGFEPLLRQVAAGRIDGAYVNVAVALAAAAAVAPAGTLVYDPGLPHSADTYRLSSRVAPEIIAEFNAWMAARGPLVRAIITRTGAETGLDTRNSRP